MSDQVEQSGGECARVGLRLNSKKIEVITYNIPLNQPPLRTAEDNALKEVSDFKYLGWHL